jgi:hypothetical protein
MLLWKQSTSRKHYNTIFVVLEKKYICQPRSLYAMKISFKPESEIRAFLDTKILLRFEC